MRLIITFLVCRQKHNRRPNELELTFFFRTFRLQFFSLGSGGDFVVAAAAVAAVAVDVAAVGVVVSPPTSHCCDDDAPSNSWAVVAASHQQHGHVAVDATVSSTGDVAGV